MMKRTILFFTLVCLAVQLSARVSLPGLYTSHMVLQQHSNILLQGQARPNKKVTLSASWCDSVYQTKADQEGKFELRFSTPSAGGPYVLRFSDGQTTTLDDVLVGEVWIGSGQSNMEMPVAGWGKILNYEQEIAQANYPNIRLYQVQRITAIHPLDSIQSTLDGWQPCSPTSVPEFSALAYCFARELYQHLNIPIGIINSSWGGTAAETWTPQSAAAQVDEFQQQIAAANEQKPTSPACLYNGMIAPLTHFPIAGWIWYQGCDNVGRAAQYKALFPTMIQSWRKQWNLGDLPFYFVQLAGFLAPNEVQPDSKWAALREAQDAAMALPNTYRTVGVDLGEAYDIHPKNKQELAHRMALLALYHTYHLPEPCSAPEYAGYRIVGNRVLIDLHYPDGAAPLIDESSAPGFILASPDWQWHKANAQCLNGQIQVWCDEVEYPVAVRYGWADNPTCTLQTANGIHLAPFRTDKQ